jgi:hypothetical protein
MNPPMELFSILVTTTGRPPKIGAEHLLRHAERFWVGRIASAMPGPPSVMPAWAVKWQVDATVAEAQAAAMARNRNRFALDAGRGVGMACDRREALDRKGLRAEPVCTENSNTEVVMMKPAEDGL